MTRAAPSRRTAWWRGLGLGLLVGAAVWAAYFVQAREIDWFSWEVSVVPTLALAAFGAVVFAGLRPSARRSSLGFALGSLLTLPLVLGAFLAVFSLLNLE